MTLVFATPDEATPMVVDLLISPLPPEPVPAPAPLKRVAAPVTSSLIMALYISESAWKLSRNVRWWVSRLEVDVVSVLSSRTIACSAGNDKSVS